VTFDSGGLLPKGPEEMWDMKNDMGGAAAVVGAMQVLARWKAKLHVVGILGLVENMPSGHAQRPGDVVRSLSGQTVEVLHTDAEGRLVLADLIAYAKQRFAPVAMVDIATLTGSVTTVLAQEFAGLFSNDDALSSLLLDAGNATGERVWRLPLCDGFDRLIDSPIADMQNITKGRMGGSATAAQFLHRFVGKTPWAHLDIAGVAWKKDAPPGGTGFGVQLLAEFAARHATPQ
jgi:leucyl aminopeptidase